MVPVPSGQVITGDAGDNVLVGTVGADTISGLGGADTLTGGDGADTLDGGDGNDTLDGGLGNDTLIGGAGDDTLRDDYGANSFDAGAGNDRIHNGNAVAGSTVDAGAGDDYVEVQSKEAGAIINLGNGINTYYGFTVGATINGGIDSDNIILGYFAGYFGFDSNSFDYSRNTINLGDGNNYISTNTYNGQPQYWSYSNNINAGSGDDTAIISDSNTVNLGDGENTVSGRDTNTIKTGSGRDTFTLGSTNTVTGGAGVDTYKFTASSHDNIITDFAAGAGGDLIDATYLLQTVPSYPGTGNPFGTGHLRLIQDGADTKLQLDFDGAGTNNDFVTVATLLSVPLSAINAHNFASMYVVGTEADDTLAGGLGVDTLDAKAGNDTLDGGWGGDTMSGGTGNDTYIVDDTSDKVIETSGTGTGTDTVLSSVNYTLGANVENLTLETGAIAGAGNALANTISGNDADNTLSGGLGNDTLTGGSGNDTVDGGDGNDLIVGGHGAGDDTYSGGAGIDTVKYTSAVAAIAVDLSAGTAGSVASGDAAGIGTDQLSGIENVIAGNYSDRIFGSSDDNRLEGMNGDDVLDGRSGNDVLLGGNGNDRLNGGIGSDTASYAGTATGVTVSLAITAVQDTQGAGVDTLSSIENLSGSGFDDELTGNNGANTLDGGKGRDKLIGGAGNDTYVTDGVDTITENANEGTDTVQSSVTYTLGANLENLTLTGTANTSATGNDLANTLTGNSGANKLDGGTGNDTMLGGSGNDTYIVDSSSDRVFETRTASATTDAGGMDLVQSSVSYSIVGSTNGRQFIENLTLTGTAAINGTGNDLANRLTGNDGNNTLSGGAGNDTLTGNAGNDRLDGGAGNDAMLGGSGNDTYIVDSSSDRIFETTTASATSDSGGLDLVQSSVSYSIAGSTNGRQFIENLTLTGTAAINGTGNDLANRLTGNDGNNTLSGGLGNDILQGGAGNDTLNGGAGVDFADYSNATTAITANLSLTTAQNTVGAGSDTITNIEGLIGGSAGDTLTGNSSNNRLYGRGGNDTLTGGAGSDWFVFDTAPNATSNKDTITDFASGTDKLYFDHAIFAGLTLGNLTTDAFWSGAGVTAAHDATDRLIYNTTTGALYYDADGTGVTAAVQVALLGSTTHPTLAYDDFMVI